jgi:hypothetical protein
MGSVPIGQAVKDVLRRTLAYEMFERGRRTRQLARWEQAGRPVPPPHLYKQSQLKHYAERCSLDVLVETGTCLGDMVYALRDVFSEIHSIELDEALYRRARNRLAGLQHVSLLLGDSVRVLPGIVAALQRPCLFWLDAHYSGGATARGEFETPVAQELQCILRDCRVRHVILIDDAREFTGSRDYPTLDEVRSLVQQKRPGWTVEVEHDIIRIHERCD